MTIEVNEKITKRKKNGANISRNLNTLSNDNYLILQFFNVHKTDKNLSSGTLILLLEYKIYEIQKGNRYKKLVRKSPNFLSVLNQNLNSIKIYLAFTIKYTY